MSPILVRPVREQLEHDRIIRLLHGKSRRRHDAGMNPGAEHNVPVGTGPTAVYPDLVLYSTERGHRVEAVVEVETGESVNHLEALAEWAHYARIRAAFHLYVPATMVDVARRLCEDNQISVAEFWSYHTVGDDVRFTLIHRSKEAVVLEPLPPRASESRAPAPRAPAGASVGRKAVKAATADSPARSKTVAVKAPAKRAVAKRAVPKRAAAKRAPASRSAKAPAPRRKPAPVAKKAARPQKRK